MEDLGSPMCIVSMHINPLYFKRGLRLLGEIDLFLLGELPVKKLLDLQRCSPDDFQKALTDILYEIGEKLADRLLKNPNYKVSFIEEHEKVGGFSHKQACRLWTSFGLRWPVLQIWDTIPANEKVTKKLIKLLNEEPAKYEGKDMVYMYAVLVYMRTVAKQKGMGRKWKRLRPYCRDL